MMAAVMSWARRAQTVSGRPPCVKLAREDGIALPRGDYFSEEPRSRVTLSQSPSFPLRRRWIYPSARPKCSRYMPLFAIPPPFLHRFLVLLAAVTLLPIPASAGDDQEK